MNNKSEGMAKCVKDSFLKKDKVNQMEGGKWIGKEGQ